MSMLASRITNILGTVRKLVYQTEAEVLSKQRESFLKELKEITEEKKKPGYHERLMAAIASMDGFTTPQIIARPMHLVWDYEAKSKEVVNWLGGLALNKDKDQAYRAEAIYCLEHTNDPRATDYLIECLKDESRYIFSTALTVIERKLLIRSMLGTTDKDKQLANIKPENLLKNWEIKDQITEQLNSIAANDSARQRSEIMGSLVKSHGETKAKLLLIKIALDGYYKDLDAQHEAFQVLKENNGLEDLINHIRERFNRNHET